MSKEKLYAAAHSWSSSCFRYWRLVHIRYTNTCLRLCSPEQPYAELKSKRVAQVQQMAAPPDLPDARLDRADPSKEQARKLAGDNH